MRAKSENSQILGVVSDSVIARAMTGEILAWNAASSVLYGLPESAALGRDFHQCLVSTYPAPMAEIEGALNGSGRWQGSVERRSSDGRKITICVTWLLEYDDNATPVRVVEIGQPDVAVPLQVDQYTRLFTVLDIAAVSVDFAAYHRIPLEFAQGSGTHPREFLIKNPESVQELLGGMAVVDYNERFSTLFGQGDPDALLGGVGRFLADESLTIFIEKVVEAILGEQRPSRFNCTLQGLNGSKFEAELAIMPCPHARKPNLLFGIRDLSSLNQTYAELEASERRYRSLFDYMPIGLTQVDASQLVSMFTELRKRGVVDLDAYFDDHPDFLADAMEALQVEEVNQHNIEMFGARSADEMKGSVSRYWQASAATMRRSLAARYRGDDMFQEETKVTRMDGSPLDVIYAAARNKVMPNKSLVGFIDITERKRSEAALRRSERRYQNLFQAMTVSFWELDLTHLVDEVDKLLKNNSGDLRSFLRNRFGLIHDLMKAVRIVDVNEQTLALFGGNRNEALQWTFDLFWPEDSLMDFASALASVLEDGSSTMIETRLKKLDGKTFDAQFTFWLMDGDQSRGLAAVVDISERVRAYSQLEQSEQRYKDLFHHMPIPVLQADSTALFGLLSDLKRQGVTDIGQYLADHPDFISRAMDSSDIAQANEAAVRLLGARDPIDLQGSMKRLWGKHPGTLAGILDSLFQGFGSYQEEIKVTTLDGRSIEGILTVAFPPTLAELGIMVHAFVDTTDKSRAEIRVRQVEAEFAHAARVSMLGELTASIAHEVNQPLAAITTNGEAGLRWLRRPKPDLREIEELTVRIVSEAKRAANVIARVRGMALHRKPEHEILSVDDVIREALIFLKHELLTKSIKVTHYPETGEAHVVGDRTQLQQVIVNLAVNAAQAMMQSPEVSRKIDLRTIIDGSSVRCVVEDSGPGIEQEHSGRLFESFFTTKSEGMGMGLAICRSIVEAHGGDIYADGESMIGGARFTFVLPTASVDGSATGQTR